jgi:hypothetical protein
VHENVDLPKGIHRSGQGIGVSGQVGGVAGDRVDADALRSEVGRHMPQIFRGAGAQRYFGTGTGETGCDCEADVARCCRHERYFSIEPRPLE